MSKLIRHSKPWITAKDFIYVNKSLISKFLTVGHNSEIFTKNLMQKFGLMEEPLITESGAQAIKCALELIKSDNKHEIIMPSYLCIDVLNVVLEIGMKAVVVDIDECGFISMNQVEAAITENTLAIIVPQLFGKIHEITPFMNLGCYVIEDSCQNLDASPLKAHFRTYSLGSTKPITAVKGGILVVRDTSAFNSSFSRNILDNYRGKLTEIEFALGVSQLKKISKNLAKRKKIAKGYTKTGIETIPEQHQTEHQSYRYLVRHRGTFDEIAKYFLEKNIIVRRGVDNLLHQSLGLSAANFPNSMHLYDNFVSIPIYPSLTLYERFRIRRCLREISRKTK